MRFVRVDGEVLRGSLYDNGLQAVAIEIGTVVRIDAEKIEPLRTTGAVVGGVLLVPVLVYGMAWGWLDW